MKRIYFLHLLFFCFQIATAQNNTNVFDVARKGTLEEAKQLLKANPKAFHVVNEEGFSPLTLACYRGNNEVAKLIVENGADINHKSPSGTPLMASIVKGNNDMIAFLLLKNTDVNLTDETGITALMYAAMFKNKNAVLLLLQKNADKTKIDAKGKTAFEYAVFSGQEEIINLLK
jgi:ankyrin repeat protein